MTLENQNGPESDTFDQIQKRNEELAQENMNYQSRLDILREEFGHQAVYKWKQSR